MKRGKRIVVAMSGGVDSSMAAYLLLEAGYQVIGVTMRFWPGEDSQEREKFAYGCCGLRDAEDARRMAHQMGIPFYVVNLEQDFDRLVVDYFCQEYLRGRTPNPCIVCNEKVKFGRLLEKALELEADFIATGHYSRIEYDGKCRRYLLRRGVDPQKDQSYVLFSLTQDQLARVQLPLGDLHKSQVREMARRFGMRVSDKSDSQEICFVKGRDYREFLDKRIGGGPKPGRIVDTHGRTLGTHNGVSAFTIGQRRGLGISAGHPLYVIDIDSTTNAVVVAPREEAWKNRCVASGMNWIAAESLSRPERVMAQIRYNHPSVEAVAEPIEANRVSVRFNTSQRAVTPGQAVVLYRDDVVLGGGWIERDRSVPGEFDGSTGP